MVGVVRRRALWLLGGGRVGFQALLVVAAILLYALAFWHGKHGGFSRHCHCPEPSDPLISIFERADPKVVASCVLHDRPTRGILHSRLARCLGRSRWSLAEHPEQISTAATSWSDGEKELQSSLGNEEVPPFQGVEGEASIQASEEALPLAGSEGIETPSQGFAHPSWSEESNPVAAEPSFGQGVDSPASEGSKSADALQHMQESAISMANAIVKGEFTADGAPARGNDGSQVESVRSRATEGRSDAPSSRAVEEAGIERAGSSLAAVPAKRVITYSLYGSVPKYVNGAVANARAISQIFPGWSARFYTDMGTVPTSIIEQIREAGGEIVPVDMAKHGSQSMFWRFWAAADQSVERFICRDVDSRLMQRDAVAVNEWIASGRAFHVIRDHPSHSLYPMSGGLWGARRNALPQIMSLIASFPTDSEYLTDMNFLNSMVWHIAMRDVLQHDGYSCDRFEGANPFPVPRDPEGYHVGQVFDADGKARQSDVDALLRARQPAECVPGGNGHPVKTVREPEAIAAECQQLKTQYGVNPGTSWGSMPKPSQLHWARLACDARLQ